MATRDPNDMHPVLRDRWFYLKRKWAELYPDEDQPRLSAVFRNEEEQNEAVRRGASTLEYPKSLHNHSPAYAFDIYFHDDSGTPDDSSDDVADWTPELYERFAQLAKPLGLEWGGDWQGLRDGPHFQLPMNHMDALAGNVPSLPPLPTEQPVTRGWKVNVMEDEEIVYRGELTGDFVISTRQDSAKRTYYVFIRRKD